MAQEIHKALGNVVEGLDYPSESDAPFDGFCWPASKDAVADSALAQVAAHVPRGAQIQELSVAEFFEPLNDSAECERFQVLRHVLQSLLPNASVFRAGEIEVQIYLIGKTPTGDWAGLHTVSVET